MTPPQTPLPSHVRQKINRLAHAAGIRHELKIKASITKRLIEVRAAAGFAAIGPALEHIIEAELKGSAPTGR